MERKITVHTVKANGITQPYQTAKRAEQAAILLSMYNIKSEVGKESRKVSMSFIDDAQED